MYALCECCEKCCCRVSEVILLRINLSRILRGLQRRDIGLYDDGSVGDLDGFSIGTILPSFLMLGLVFCWVDRFKMSVGALGQHSFVPGTYERFHKQKAMCNQS